MNKWLEVYKHLLPSGIAWSITVDKMLRRFIDGLTELPADVKTYLDAVFLDLIPSTTTKVSRWLVQFNIVASGNEAQDRQTLDGAWRLNEYQSPKQIQDTIQAAGFDIYIHEWWELPVVGSPIAKNPFLYLASLEEATISLAGAPQMLSGGSGAVSGGLGFVVAPYSLTSCDEPIMLCDEPEALCDNSIIPVGYPLVNKTGLPAVNTIPGPTPSVITACDADFMFCDEPDAECDNFQNLNVNSSSYILYFAGEVFPDVVEVDIARKDELETLLLKICPTEQWLGLLIKYI